MELWSLLSITSPGLFPDPKRFAERYARPIERGGDAEQLARLRRRIKPLLKRRLDGRTRRRDRVLERFKDGNDPVFLISLKAGGFGLNLTEADYCFLLDPWWNPATEAQAIDRTHRIGQTRPVMAYRMISRDTIEEKVAALARRKAALFSGVMDEGDLFASSLTAEDVRGLLG